MPGRNLERFRATDSYFHIYNRGVNRRIIYKDKEDYQFFEQLFARHLGAKPVGDAKGREYLWFRPQVDLLAYCLMPTHFHLLMYQKDDDIAISKLLQSICTAYTMYFNKKYKRRGPLYENNFRASHITSDSYLLHISRYIHLNPKNYMSWPYSSYDDYVNIPSKDWLKVEPLLELFDSRAEYIEFVNDYKAMRDELEDLKYELADSGKAY